MADHQPQLNLRQWDAIAHVLTGHGLAMGREGMLGGDVVSTLLAAIDRVRDQPIESEDLIEAVRAFDARIDSQLSADVAAAGRTARSIVDVSAAVGRLVVLSDLSAIDRHLARCAAAVIGIARSNIPVLMPVTMDGFVSQPTSVAHWLGALIEQIGRARDVVLSTWDAVDRSPMGAGAMAASGFSVDRARLARDLGFNVAVESTFDAVASLDWLGQAANAIDAALGPLLRFGNEVFTWFRIEPDAFRIGDWLMETASGIPQWSGPYGLVRLNGELEHVAFQAHVLAHEASSVTYGPQLATLARIARGVHAIAGEAIELLRQFAHFLEDGLIVNAGYFANRAGRSFSTSSDLADFLILEEHLAPGEAEQIATLTISRARDQGLEAAGITVDLIDGAAMMVIGRELKVEFEAISRYLAPRRFIERRSVLGAPSPATMRTFLTHRAQDEAERDARLSERRKRVQMAVLEMRTAGESMATELRESV